MSPAVEQSKSLPSWVDMSKYPKLSAEQAGHLRHFHNLSSAPDGQWPHMGAQEPMQEFLDAYRYQLATMLYGSAVAHYHRLPALRGTFKPLMHRLIRKMLRREVWGYWFLASHSGKLLDPDLARLREPWADPIRRENIMYSGHLLLMTSLYAMLFDDAAFEQPGSLTFDWAPLFWGMGPESFAYDNRSVQRAVLAEMQRNGWAGVCCEPNQIFVVCNQFPVLALRYNDVRDGTRVFDEVIAKYEAALIKKKMISQDGYYADSLAVRQDRLLPASDAAFTAWAGAFMNAWKPAYVRAGYAAHIAGTVTSVDGQVRMHDARIAGEMRRRAALPATEGGIPINTRESVAAAVEAFKAAVAAAPEGAPAFPYTKPTMGLVLQYLSELGKRAELDGLLAYADARLRPTWEHGGLFYPRNEQVMDEDTCDWTFMDPLTGNACIGYARLNVEDGQRVMFERPWTRESLAGVPYVDGLDLADGVDCLRGIWDAELQAMIVTVRPWRDETTHVKFQVKNLPAGAWSVYKNGALQESPVSEVGDGVVDVGFSVGFRKEVDIVVCKTS